VSKFYTPELAIDSFSADFGCFFITNSSAWQDNKYMGRNTLFFLLGVTLGYAGDKHVAPVSAPVDSAQQLTFNNIEAVRAYINTADQNGHFSDYRAHSVYQGKKVDPILKRQAQMNASWYRNQNGDKIYSVGEFANGGKNLLQNLTEIGGKCIPKLTVSSHGWSASRPSGGDGIPLYNMGYGGARLPGAGLYLDEATRREEVRKAIEKYHSDWADELKAQPDGGRREMEEVRRQYTIGSETSSATLADFKEIITNGTIRGEKQTWAIGNRRKRVTFCDSCMIQLYGCNMSDRFARELAATTKCQVIYGTGDLTGVDRADGKYDHIWISGKKTNNTRDGAIYSITPDHNGDVRYSTPVKLTQPGKTGWDSVNMRIVNLHDYPSDEQEKRRSSKK
jgi:hypothetical protein